MSLQSKTFSHVVAACQRLHDIVRPAAVTMTHEERRHLLGQLSLARRTLMPSDGTHSPLYEGEYTPRELFTIEKTAQLMLHQPEKLNTRHIAKAKTAIKAILETDPSHDPSVPQLDTVIP